MTSNEMRSIISSIKLLPDARLVELESELAESEAIEEMDLVKRLKAEIARRLAAQQLVDSKKKNARQDMTVPEELHAKFYAHEKLLVKDMDLLQLREHIEELSKIAFEAKARHGAAYDEMKERKAKTSNKEWLVTDTTPNVNVTDAINAVKTRAARMSKMDKVQEGLRKAGIDEETIKEMTRNLEQRATDKTLKTITFTRPAAELTSVQVKVKSDAKVPFDPSTLKFGK